jgi:hypothetical protein
MAPLATSSEHGVLVAQLGQRDLEHLVQGPGLLVAVADRLEHERAMASAFSAVSSVQLSAHTTTRSGGDSTLGAMSTAIVH